LALPSTINLDTGTMSQQWRYVTSLSAALVSLDVNLKAMILIALCPSLAGRSCKLALVPYVCPMSTGSLARCQGIDQMLPAHTNTTGSGTGVTIRAKVVFSSAILGVGSLKQLDKTLPQTTFNRHVPRPTPCRRGGSSSLRGCEVFKPRRGSA
jgi:hypothetical protein